MKVTNVEAQEWRRRRRGEIVDQLHSFLERIGRRGSKKSMENAVTGMVVFCSFMKMLPKELVEHVKKNDVYSVLDNYVGWLVNECKVAPNSLKDYLSVAKKFLRFSDIEISNDRFRAKVELPRIYTKTRDRAPTPDELRRVLTHTNTRGKALITMLASSGMRVGELLSLRVKDVDFSKRPTTIYLRAEVTKDRQARYCFISDEATMLLKEFLGERINRKNDYIFQTSTRGRKHKTGNVPMSYWNADHIFSSALRASGLEEKDEYGRDVIHIHSLRKFFFSQLVPVLGREVVEALMGHKEFLDASYRRFTEDQMREFYLKGMSAVTILMLRTDTERIKREAALEAMRAVAMSFGIDYMKVRIEKQKEIGKELNADEEIEVIQNEIKKFRTMANSLPNGGKPCISKLITEDELVQYVEGGWDIVKELSNGRFLIKKPNHLPSSHTLRGSVEAL